MRRHRKQWPAASGKWHVARAEWLVNRSRDSASYSRLPTPDSLLPAPHSQLPTPYSLLPTPDSLPPTPYSPHPTPFSLFPTPHSPLARHSTGFTIIELLIVVAVMGILAGLVLPRSDPSLHDQLRSAAQIMAADLAYGRSLAVTHNSEYRFTFDLANNRYILEHSGDDPALDTLPQTPFRSPDDPPKQQIVALDELPRVGPGVQIVGAAQGSPTQPVVDVEFGPLGATTRSEETIVWLAAGTGSGRRYIELHINPVTGLTTVELYSGIGPP